MFLISPDYKISPDLASYLMLGHDPFQYGKMPDSLVQGLEQEFVLLLKHFNSVEEMYSKISMR